MTKTQMVTAIAECKLRLNKWLERINVRPGIVDIPYDDLGYFTYKHVADAYKWLQSIANTTLKEVESTWKLLTPTQWKRYEDWGDFGEHQESILLTRALIKLRKAITARKRPNLFKRTFTDVTIRKAKRLEHKKQIAGIAARHKESVRRNKGTADKESRAPSNRTITTPRAKPKDRPK